MTKYRFDRDDHYLWIPKTGPGHGPWEFDVPTDVMDRYVRAYIELTLAEAALTETISDQPGYKP